MGQTYGSPRMTKVLKTQGFNVNRKRVARLMREEGLTGIPKRRFRGCTTDSHHDRPVPKNLLWVHVRNGGWSRDLTRG